MHWSMHQALRCHATSKRSGKPCRSPAVRGHNVCRMHGAGGGAPKGNRNACVGGRRAANRIRRLSSTGLFRGVSSEPPDPR